MEKDKIILFGAGLSGEAFIRNTNLDPNLVIIAVADNDETKQGASFHGFPVIKPNQILELEYDFIIITSGFASQIRKQLVEDLGIDPSKIQIPPKMLLCDYGMRNPFEDPETLLLAKDILVFIGNTFKTNSIAYFADHGTLLGIVRDRDLIRWDSDIDITVYEEDIDRALECIINSMHEFSKIDKLKISGNAYYQPNGTLSVFSINVEYLNSYGAINGFPISISTVAFQNGFAILPTTYAPEHHFKTFQLVEFHGSTICVPCDYEKYLEFQYGDWRTPKKEISYLDILNMKTDWTINSYYTVPILFKNVEGK